MADVAGGGPQILEALLKTDSASSWNQDRLADFGKKTRKEARALVKGAGGESLLLTVLLTVLLLLLLCCVVRRLR